MNNKKVKHHQNSLRLSIGLNKLLILKKEEKAIDRIYLRHETFYSLKSITHMVTLIET